jgi:hypothetical protein
MTVVPYQKSTGADLLNESGNGTNQTMMPFNPFATELITIEIYLDKK